MHEIDPKLQSLRIGTGNLIKKIERNTQKLLDFPKVLHPLYRFEEAGVSYAADLKKARVVELSAVMKDILELAETRTNAAIVETLRDVL